MFKHSIISFTLLISNFILSSQTINISPISVYSEDLPLKYKVVTDDGRIYTVHKSGEYEMQTYNGSWQDKYSMGYYDSKNRLIDFILIPRKIENEKAYFIGFFTFKNKLFVQMETKVEDKVFFWLLKFNTQDKSFHPAFNISKRAGRTMWERQGGYFKLKYDEVKREILLYTFDWRGIKFREPSEFTLSYFTEKFELKSTTDINIPNIPRGTISNTFLEDEGNYFIIRQIIDNNQFQLEYGELNKKDNDYWLYKENGKDSKKIQLGVGDYEISKPKIFIDHNNVTVFSTLRPTILSKKKHKEKMKDHGFYVSKTVDFNKQYNYLLNKEELSKSLGSINRLNQKKYSIYLLDSELLKNGNLLLVTQIITNDKKNILLLEVNAEKKYCSVKLISNLRPVELGIGNEHEAIFAKIINDKIHLFYSDRVGDKQYAFFHRVYNSSAKLQSKNKILENSFSEGFMPDTREVYDNGKSLLLFNMPELTKYNKTRSKDWKKQDVAKYLTFKY